MRKKRRREIKLPSKAAVNKTLSLADTRAFTLGSHVSLPTTQGVDEMRNWNMENKL